ncbi:MAG: two-component regulator propeller domain-containing protein [Chitinophagales bacterium]|nr:two-component regulator propeller domain-containing protein [Chitinophagales bacterium]
MLLLLLVGLVAVQANAQGLGIGQWRAHLPYRQGLGLAHSSSEVFCISNVTFYAFEKETGVIQKYDKVIGLSDVKVTNIAYSEAYDALVVVYDNTNIDLIKNNTIYNVSDIQRKSIVGEKRVNSIYLKDSIAYLACTFGIVAFDIKNQEIKDTYYIGDLGEQLSVNNIVSDGAKLYAATLEGLRVANLSSPNLINFQEWQLDTSLPKAPITQVVLFQDILIVNINDSLFIRNGTTWPLFYEQANWTITQMDVSDNHLLVCETDGNYTGRIARFNNDLGFASPIVNDRIRLPQDIYIDEDSIAWIADEIEGLLRIAPDGTTSSIQPNGPGSAQVANLSFAGGNLWVARGPVPFSGNYLQGGLDTYGEGYWTYRDEFNTSELADFNRIHTVLAKPSGDGAYLAAFTDGLIDFGNPIARYDETNSPLQVRNGDAGNTPVTGLALDASGNLWMSNFETSTPLVVKKADGSFKAFRPTPLVPNGSLGQLVIDDNGYIWAQILSSSAGLMVFNNGGTIDDLGDDRTKILTTATGNGGLPSNSVSCLAKDREGEIWVGTGEGIAVFYCPGSIFSDFGCDAQQILVSEGGFAGYLLATEAINVIAVDGANRKWVGTNNGLWLFSADGTEQLAYFNTDNSPLISNTITSLAIDGVTGEVFIGSADGLVSYRGDATTGGEEFADTLLVFPNPVRETYHGPIAIKGLTTDAEVKITDVRGTLIYQTTANGGQAIWDGRNFDGREAKAGVYLVFAIKTDGTASKVTKLLLMR